MASTNVRVLPGTGFVDSDKISLKIPHKAVVFYLLVTIRPKIELLTLEINQWVSVDFFIEMLLF